jgi:hypothetical protein
MQTLPWIKLCCPAIGPGSNRGKISNFRTFRCETLEPNSRRHGGSKQKGNMKIVTIGGARPQFIRAGAISRAIKEFDRRSQIRRDKKRRIQEILVHTGQHYDYRMDSVFFLQNLDFPGRMTTRGGPVRMPSRPRGCLNVSRLSSKKEILLLTSI